MPAPSRAKLDRADAAIETFETTARDELADIARRERELAGEKKTLLAQRGREQAKLTKQRNVEAEDYDRAVRKWRST